MGIEELIIVVLHWGDDLMWDGKGNSRYSMATHQAQGSCEACRLLLHMLLCSALGVLQLHLYDHMNRCGYVVAVCGQRKESVHATAKPEVDRNFE